MGLVSYNYLYIYFFFAKSCLSAAWTLHSPTKSLIVWQDGLRPVIYYCEHLIKDMDETKTFSRALISFVKYDNPKTIMHPMLVFVLDILWEQLVSWLQKSCENSAQGCRWSVANLMNQISKTKAMLNQSTSLTSFLGDKVVKAKISFFLDRVLTMISFVVFLLATCTSEY